MVQGKTGVLLKGELHQGHIPRGLDRLGTTIQGIRIHEVGVGVQLFLDDHVYHRLPL
jgi:hypothetical protein